MLLVSLLTGIVLFLQTQTVAIPGNFQYFLSHEQSNEPLLVYSDDRKSYLAEIRGTTLTKVANLTEAGFPGWSTLEVLHQQSYGSEIVLPSNKRKSARIVPGMRRCLDYWVGADCILSSKGWTVFYAGEQSLIRGATFNSKGQLIVEIGPEKGVPYALLLSYDPASKSFKDPLKVVDRLDLPQDYLPGVAVSGQDLIYVRLRGRMAELRRARWGTKEDDLISESRTPSSFRPDDFGRMVTTFANGRGLAWFDGSQVVSRADWLRP